MNEAIKSPQLKYLANIFVLEYRNIYEPLNKTSSQLVRVVAASGPASPEISNISSSKSQN